ncbi:glycosyltransferase family 39 protein [Candidatus Leptofilum sp.]|uniref:glycosyltransferase family 39 protein n=1 Tax=Candidatus Leptofilum sp. TaxID=3241576 RepID=UPI003B591D01
MRQFPKWLYPLLLAGLILLITLLQVRWIRQDARYQPFVDPYPQRALEIADHLSANGLADLPQLIMETRIGPRSPLYQFGAAIFVLLFGRSLDAMLVLNLVMNGLLMIGAYGMGKLMKNRQSGLLAALLVGTLPPIMQLTRIIRPHSVLPAMVMLWLWLLLRLLKHRTVRDAWLFCLVLLLTLWLHPNAIYMVLPPTFILVVYAIFSAGGSNEATAVGGFSWRGVAGEAWGCLKRPHIIKGLLPGLVIAGLLTAAWYYLVRDDVSGLVVESATNWSSERYGFSNIPASPFWYLWTLPGVITNFFTYLFGAGLVVYLFVKRPYRFMLSLTFILMYVGMGLRQGTLAWMNFAAVLPVVGVITAVFIMDLQDALGDAPSQRLGELFTRCLLVTAVFVAIFNAYVVTAELGDNSERLAQTLGAPLETSCGWRMVVAYCPNPPRQQNWQELAILQTILEDERCSEATCSVAVVTESAEIFSFASLRYFRMQNFPQAELSIVPIRRHGRYSADWLTTDYVVYIPQLKNNPYANGVSTVLQNPSETFGDIFEDIAQFPLPRGWDVHVLHRARSLTEAEVSAYLAELDVPANLKASLSSNFSFQDLEE